MKIIVGWKHSIEAVSNSLYRSVNIEEKMLAKMSLVAYLIQKKIDFLVTSLPCLLSEGGGPDGY